MKKYNSTDLGDIKTFCKKVGKESTRKNWNDIFRNTRNLQAINADTATGVNAEAKITTIFEQIREKKEYFEKEQNRYWSITKNIGIFEEWYAHYNFEATKLARGTFEILSQNQTVKKVYT